LTKKKKHESKSIDKNSFISNVYSILVQRRNLAIQILENNGIKKGDGAYQEITSAIEYDTFNDWMTNALHIFSSNNTPSAGKAIHNFSSEIAKQLLPAIFYLDLDDTLMMYIERFIDGNNNISVRNCFIVAGFFAELERCGAAMGMQGVGIDKNSRRQSEIAKKGRTSNLNKEIDKILGSNPELSAKEIQKKVEKRTKLTDKQCSAFASRVTRRRKLKSN